MTSAITRECLRKLTLEELDTLLDAVKAAGEAWNGVANQPRARDQRIEQVIGIELERCDGLEDDIVKEAASRKPAGVREIERRARILIRQYALGGDWKAVIEAAMPAALANERDVALAVERNAKAA